jgi:hypothetical protein
MELSEWKCAPRLTVLVEGHAATPQYLQVAFFRIIGWPQIEHFRCPRKHVSHNVSMTGKRRNQAESFVIRTVIPHSPHSRGWPGIIAHVEREAGAFVV